MPDEVEGGCLCGAVRFVITLPTKWCAHCHCSMCRRAHGAPYVTFCGVPSKQFRVAQGADQIRRYKSSNDAVRSFCKTCGTMLLFEGSRWKDEVHVARATIEGDLDREPQAHCYYDDRATWVTVNDALPKLGGPNGNEAI